MSAELAVQGAIYTALAAADYSGATASTVTVRDADGQLTGAPTAPYIAVGYIILTEWDTVTETGHEFTARIHTRSPSKSMAEVKGIQGVIYNTLHRHPLTMTSQINIVLMRQTSMCDRAPDGTFHGVCEYHGFIQAT